MLPLINSYDIPIRIHLFIKKLFVTFTAMLLARCMTKHSSAKAPDISINQAVYEGNIEIINQYLSFGADINTKDAGGWSPLHWAVGEGYEKIIKLLLFAHLQIWQIIIMIQHISACNENWVKFLFSFFLSVMLFDSSRCWKQMEVAAIFFYPPKILKSSWTSEKRGR